MMECELGSSEPDEEDFDCCEMYIGKLRKNKMYK